MLTRARSLFSRVFSIDKSTSQIRLDENFDNIDDSFSDDDSNFSENEEKYEKQINDYSNRLITSMQIALSRCNIESIKHLLNNSDIDINHRDQYGMSYLEHAILIGNFDMVNLLIKYGCDLNLDNSNGHSYLYIAIEITTNKSFEIIHLLLESNCSCLSLIDINSLISLKQILYINSKDFILLNKYLLIIFKYHINRMLFDDILNLINYLINTNLLICKNDEYYQFDLSTKQILNQFNNDYIILFIKSFGIRYALKFEQKLHNLQTLPSSLLIPITNTDIQPYINKIIDLKKSLPELKHLCRLLIRKNFKLSTIKTVISSVELHDYLLFKFLCIK